MSSGSYVYEPPVFSFKPVETSVLDVLADAGRARPPSKVVAVTAPTGYGKTVLLTMLCERYRNAGTDCRWLSLDDRDTSVERLVTLLEMCLLSASGPVSLQQAMHQGDDPVDERILSLLDSLARLTAPVVLFIDNLNFCTDETLRYLLDALMFRTSSSLQLVLSSTMPLPMDQTRAKLEGRLLSFGMRELSLSQDEVLGLLGEELTGRMSAAVIDAVVAQSEGWPAAVRLMQIVLSSAAEPEAALERYSGADEDLADLLNRQVLDAFDAPQRAFLLELSLLRQFSSELAEAATGNQQAGAQIDSLLARNLFVIPLDRNRSWYRLHALFREFLMDEAARTIPETRRREVLARAATWCEQDGRWYDAIEYALASESTPLATAILDRVAALFVRDRGDLNQYIQWVEKLKATGAECGWEADFWYVWALVFHRRYEYARQQTERLSRRVLAADSGNLSDIRRRLEIIRFSIDTYTDRFAETRNRAVAWLDEAHEDDPFDRATIAAAVSIDLSSNFHLGESRKYIRLAQSYASQSSSDYGVGWVNLLSALISIQEGDFAAAYQELQTTNTRVRAALGEHSGIVSTISMLLAKAAVEMNLEAEAREALAIGIKKASSHGVVETAACGLDAAVKLWSDQESDPVSLPMMREIAASYPPRVALMLSCSLIRRLLALGRLDDALLEAKQIDLSVTDDIEVRAAIGVPDTASMRDQLTAARIELLIASGRLKPAARLIAAETKAARSDGRFGRLVELALDEASISLRSHNTAPAVRHIARAIAHASRRRYLRPFRERADLVAGIVNETKARDWGFASEDERRFFAEICAGLPLAEGAAAPFEGGDGTAGLTETPTARELELLALMETGLTNQQLADRLAVSVATVKWHLYNLYTKLGVSSRSAAIARARALNLLAR